MSRLAPLLLLQVALDLLLALLSGKLAGGAIHGVIAGVEVGLYLAEPAQRFVDGGIHADCRLDQVFLLLDRVGLHGRLVLSLVGQG